MTTIEELDARLAELEARLAPAPMPQANPPVAIGDLADVPAPGSAIASAWAQEVTARMIPRYATLAVRDAAPATGRAFGSVCAVSTALYVWAGNKWVQPGELSIIALGNQANIGSVVTIPGSGFTLPSTQRRYLVSAIIPVFKGGGAGNVALAASVSGSPTPPTFSFGFSSSPLSSVISAWWVLPGDRNGGALAISAAVGTVDVTAGGYLTVQDVGGLVA